MNTEVTTWEAEHGNQTDVEYEKYLARVSNRYAISTANGTKPVFQTSVENLFQVYLAAFPEEIRQHHNCNACRRFIERFGGLVTIDDNGEISPALWNIDDTYDPYYEPVKRMIQAIKRAKVTGVFLAKEHMFGEPKTGVWVHLHAKNTAVFHNPLLTAFQAMAVKKQDFLGVLHALDDFKSDVVKQSLRILESNTLYRAEKVIGPARWFDALQTAIAGKGTKQSTNLIWRAVATAVPGFAHIRSTMIGTLLEDIVAKHSFESVAARFADKMRTYQRAQVAPTAGAIQQAENIIEKMGLAPALARRYARLDELMALWTPVGAPSAKEDDVKAVATSVFGHLKAGGNADVAAVAELNIPAQPITFDRFVRTVLPTAKAVEVIVPAASDRFAALVTAVDPDAPPLLQWDAPEARNPVSWYYASGVDAEIKQRVVAAGGQHGDVDIRASLIWNNRNDLDLSCITPDYEQIYYGSKRSRSGGYLDVDMNVRGETTKPVENIRWAKGTAPRGRYEFRVWNYAFHELQREDFPYRVELEVGGQVFHYDGIMSRSASGLHGIAKTIVAAFDFDGEKTQVPSTLKPASIAVSANAWGVSPGARVKVNAIVPSPNMWGAQQQAQHGQHRFFILDGCRDTQKGVGRGFFSEHLRSELRPARSTLEAFAANATIEGVDEATACGIGISDHCFKNGYGLTVRVTGPNGASMYKIDRWD